MGQRDFMLVGSRDELISRFLGAEKRPVQMRTVYGLVVRFTPNDIVAMERLR